MSVHGDPGDRERHRDRPAPLSVSVRWTTAFADGPTGGNPCPVVLGADGWDTARMRAAAEAFGAETAFVLTDVSDADLALRYFVPRHEMEMCVHATVAATVLLARLGVLTESPARVRTPLGVREVRFTGDTAVAQQFPPEFGPVVADVGPVARALGVAESDVAGPVRSVSISRAKLVVPLTSESCVDGVVVDPALLAEVCPMHEVTGLYPFARTDSGADVTARQFPLNAGYPEDPATGVAAGALACHLDADRLRVAQGRALGRPSLIDVELGRDEHGTIDAVWVGGPVRL